MTHTFVRSGEQYDIGVWLRDEKGADRFKPLVSVTTMRAAIRLVNTLNGGAGNIDSVLLRAGVMKQGEDDGAANGSQAEGTAVVRGARKGPARSVV